MAPCESSADGGDVVLSKSGVSSYAVAATDQRLTRSAKLKEGHRDSRMRR
jgi:hypothetical protein